jgi:hypothetical protein
MTPDDLNTLRELDGTAARELEREHMQNGMDSNSPNWTAAASMALLMVIAGTFSIYALPWAFKAVIKLVEGLLS